MPESVWDYPRPPRLEPTPRRIRIMDGGCLLADTAGALRMLETSHPPVYYIPPSDIAMARLAPVPRRRSLCEWKGAAAYWALDGKEVAWSYPQPTRPYSALRDHLAFYASRLDSCTVDGIEVQSQPGDFYGGWITPDILGPFKGPPGTLGW